ncbi:MAG: dihydrodipicolinate synthase family protein [Chloroflexota bacterium]
MASQWRGVFTIPVTPFDAVGDLDEQSLERCVRFCVDAGAHGVVAPVNASEAPMLSDDERKQVAEIVVATVARRIPVVVGVSGVTTRQSVDLAGHARVAGADAVIAMPPYVKKASPAEIVDFYQQLAAATELPIFIQNYGPPVGTPMSARFMADLVEHIPGVEYVKEETVHAGQLMTQLFLLSGPRLKGIMGGMAGRYLFNEVRRGACGTMPACEVTDVDVTIWNALEAGDLVRARQLHNRLIPLLNIEAMYGVAVYKEVLKRRGIIERATMRGPGVVTLDSFDQQELDRILEDVSELFTLAPLSACVAPAPE